MALLTRLRPLLACIVCPTHNNFLTNSFFIRPTMCKPSKPQMGWPSCKTQSSTTHNHLQLNCTKTCSVASSAKSHHLSTSMLQCVSRSAVVLSWLSSSSKVNTGHSLSTTTPTHSKRSIYLFLTHSILTTTATLPPSTHSVINDMRMTTTPNPSTDDDGSLPSFSSCISYTNKNVVTLLVVFETWHAFKITF